MHPRMFPLLGLLCNSLLSRKGFLSYFLCVHFFCLCFVAICWQHASVPRDRRGKQFFVARSEFSTQGVFRRVGSRIPMLASEDTRYRGPASIKLRSHSFIFVTHSCFLFFLIVIVFILFIMYLSIWEYIWFNFHSVECSPSKRRLARFSTTTLLKTWGQYLVAFSFSICNSVCIKY
jgi:hypothetical protein